MVSTINATSASGVVTTADNSTTLALQTNGTTAVYVDASQNVGIGTTSPAYKLDVAPSGTSAQSARLRNGSSVTDDNVQLRFWGKGTGSDIWAIGNNCATGGNGANFDFYDLLANANRMRIDSSGNLLVGTTSSGDHKCVITNTSQWSLGLAPAIYPANGNAYSFIVFRKDTVGGTAVGSITSAGTTTSYNTTSDYRLKHSVISLGNGLATIKALKPVAYKWKSNDSYGEGFIAHELQEVIPEAVTGTKDAVDENGNINPQGVDYSKIVVHLVAAIQELTAKVTALEAKVGA